METRQLHCELRATGKTIVGLIPYDSVEHGEVLRPGCFSESIRNNKIIALWGHDQNKPLANSAAGTLRLKDSPQGLHVEITPDQDVTWGKDSLIAAKRQDINGFSFGFTVPQGGENFTDNNIREILKADLIEVSPVTFPWYSESKVNVRGKNNMKKHDNDEITVKISKEEYEAFKSWDTDFYNDPPDIPFEPHSFGTNLRANVQDKPIYTGPFAMAAQLADYIAVSHPGNSNHEARSRVEQHENRELALRAAGTGQVESVAADGGMLLQGELTSQMATNGFNNNEVTKRIDLRNIGNAAWIESAGIDESSRATGSRGGGVRVYNDSELAEITSSKTSFKKVRVEPKRLTGLNYISNELLNNVPALQGELSSLFEEEFAFKAQDSCINGSGVGEALGIMNSDCLVTIDKESGQVAATVVYDNLLKMKARILARNRRNLVWIASQTVEPQLYQIALPVGTGGSVIPAYTPAQDQSSGVAGNLLGHPLIFVEQCQPLGTTGDIVLCDWSSYLAATKGGIQTAISAHVKFEYNQATLRFVWYFDGTPKLQTAITPFKGSDTQSPFVTLATRS